MTLGDILGTPVHDPPDPELPLPTRCGSSNVDVSAPLPEARSKGRLIGLVAATSLVLGGIGGWMTASMRPAVSTVSPLDPVPRSVPADVAGAAEMFANLYLTGTASQADLSTLYSGDSPSRSATWINSSRTVAGELFANDIWNVTVMVDSLEQVDGVYQPVPIRYFVIPISTASGRPIAFAAPAHIPPPAAAVASDTFTDPVSADQATAAATFVERYLAGGDDIDRYLSATARIPMFATAPYVSAVATPSGTDDHDRVRVAVTATDQHGIARELEYVVTLTFDRGLWEVADLMDGSR